jgi:hypothetical protein
MGKNVLLNTRLFTGGVDLTTRNNKAELAASVEEKDATAFNPDPDVLTFKEVLGGIISATINADGQWEAGDASKVDDALWLELGGLSAWTLYPLSAVPGQLAYLAKAMQGSYKLGGQIGDVASWTAAMASSWPIPRGIGLHNPGTARIADGAGTAFQHVAVPAGKNLYATAHLLSVAGTATPTITLAVESDTADDFTGSETEQISFDPMTALGGQILRVPGPITDTWFRPTWTITGTGPSFLFALAIGVA